jgi:hypothetical protein
MLEAKNGYRCDGEKDVSMDLAGVSLRYLEQMV